MSAHTLKQSSAQSGVSIREMLISSAAALIALLITVTIARLLLTPSAQPFLVASMGATAVLLYAAHASPMAQPWAVFGGHIVSALIGATCARYIPDTAWAAAAAGSGAILAMYLLRCMHPPGGATALMPVAAASVGSLGYSYVLAPVGIDVVLMLILALLINHYVLRRGYPAARAHVTSGASNDGAPEPPVIQPPFDEGDLAQALHRMDTFIDVTHDDLMRIYRLARMEVYARRAGDRRCSEFMQPVPAPLECSTPLAEAFARLKASDLNALPVVDGSGVAVGTMGMEELHRHARAMPSKNPATRLEELLRPSPDRHGIKPENVGQVMNDKPLMFAPGHPVKDLLFELAERERRIVLAVDTDHKLLGVIEPTALMGQLHRLAVAPAEQAASAA